MATTEVATTKNTKPAKSTVSSLSIGNADDALTLAKELQKFVKNNKLTTNIQGKEFPNVEAWQFAGSLLGLSPMLESIEDRSVTDGEIKWNATVSILNTRTGAVVGRGFATCSNKESTKKYFADYAICSMAQTRAVGKAYRLSLGWLMKAAGYEATPIEEMDSVTSATVVESPKPVAAPSVQDSPSPAQSGGAEGSGDAASIVYATGTQREEIDRLIQMPCFDAVERTKVIKGLPKLTEAQADKVITKLAWAAQEREEGRPGELKSAE